MSNLLHPGLILIAVGVLAVLVPKMLRKFYFGYRSVLCPLCCTFYAGWHRFEH